VFGQFLDAFELAVQILGQDIPVDALDLRRDARRESRQLSGFVLEQVGISSFSRGGHGRIEREIHAAWHSVETWKILRSWRISRRGQRKEQTDEKENGEGWPGHGMPPPVAMLAGFYTRTEKRAQDKTAGKICCPPFRIE